LQWKFIDERGCPSIRPGDTTVSVLRTCGVAFGQVARPRYAMIAELMWDSDSDALARLARILKPPRTPL